MRGTTVVLIIVFAATSWACRDASRASETDCIALLDRLVELDLEARGIRDPVLSDRWRTEARGRFGPELFGCRDKKLSRAALACAQQAQSTEELAHVCLR